MPPFVGAIIQPRSPPASSNKTPVARALGSDIGDGIELGSVDVGLTPIAASPVFSRFSSSRLVFQLADRISTPLSTLSGYFRDEPEVSFGVCGFCVLFVVLLILLLAISQISASL